jgi:hypothetical protein
MKVSCLAYYLALKMEATYCSEASVDFQLATRRYIPGDKTFHVYFSLSHLHFHLEAFFYLVSLFLLETILSSLLHLKYLALPFQVLPSPIGPLTAPVPFATSLYMHSHSRHACVFFLFLKVMFISRPRSRKQISLTERKSES